MKNNHNVKNYGLFLFVLLLTLTCKQQETGSNENWISLFNGKDLSGWDIKISGHELNDNYKNTFRVEDGMLRIAYDAYKTFDNKFGHLYYQIPYSHYKLRFQYRFTGNQTPGGADWNVRNSGVMIHSQSAKSVELNQDFPVSLEVQLLGGLDKGERPTGNICTPGTLVYMEDSLRQEHCISSSSKTYHGDQWVSALVEVYGDSLIRHIIEGDTVLTYTKPIIGGGFVSDTHNWQAAHIENFQYWLDRDNTPLNKGYISLQAESHPIDFKSIELLDLKGLSHP
jgi:hypothetical protein